jgi:Na+/H+-dicarboxylate symporter
MSGVAAPPPVTAPPPGPPRPSDRSLPGRYRRLSLGTKILLFMAGGVILGIVAPGTALLLAPLGTLFIRLLMMAAIPLVFFSLLAGLTSLDGIGSMGRVGVKIMAFYLTTTTAALTLGLIAMSVLRPGAGMQLDGEVPAEFGEVPGISQVLLDLVPANVFAAFSNADVAQIVVFAVLLGIATLLLPEAKRAPLHNIFGMFADLFRKLVELVMRFGPIGIAALSAATVAEYGAQLFGPLALFLVGIWTAQACMFLVQMGLLTVLTEHRPLDFLRRTGPLYATAAATCSSLASLAVAMEMAGERLKLPRSIYAFTLPLGAQLNKDGTSIMLTAVLLFTAQAAGVQFDLVTTLTILLVGLILSEGSGGIPGGGLVIAMIFVQAFHLPLEIAVVVGGIYRLIDMGSTTINVTGDLVGTAIVAHSELRRSGSS